MNSFSSEHLEKSLLGLDDLMARMAASENYFLLGDTAREVKEGALLTGEKIEAGLEERYLNPEARSTLQTFFPNATVGENYISLELEGVPVEVKIIKRKYTFFKNPDILIYGPEEYQLPNPMDVYQKSRYLVR